MQLYNPTGYKEWKQFTNMRRKVVIDSDKKAFQNKRIRTLEELYSEIKDREKENPT